MGNVEVQYKPRRGANAAGTEVTNPKDWWTHICNEDFDKVKAAFDAATPEQRAAVLAAMDGADEETLRSAPSLEMWVNENEDDEEFMRDAMEKVCQLFG